MGTGSLRMDADISDLTSSLPHEQFTVSLGEEEGNLSLWTEVLLA